MIKAVIFDMDGLLIDSEPIWQKVTMKVFQDIGISLSQKQVQETTGLRVDEVVEHWFIRFPQPGIVKEKVAADIVLGVISEIKKNGIAKQGVEEIISLFKTNDIPMAIASSSATDIIAAVMEKLNLTKKITIVHSAEHEPYGKPHPGVYITAAEKLGIPPVFCLAFEDSPNGVLAAKAARMKCIAVPDYHGENDPRFGIADLTIKTLSDFTLEQLESL